MSAGARLRRLFASDGRCFDIAIDHGFFNEASFLNGIEDMPRAVQALVAAEPDAIQLSPGQAHLLQDLPGPHKPALVLRVDVGNVYGAKLPRHLFSELIAEPVEQALRLDAACLVVNLLLLPEQPELYQSCLQNVLRLKPTCEQFGMPLMVEPLVMRPNKEAGGYMVDGDPEKVVPLVRQAAECGADVIKADPTDPISDYHRVIEAAGGRPVLPRGGGKVSDLVVLQRTYELIQQGASGIVYGRNVIQHESPTAMTRALMEIVHDGATPDQALRILQVASTRSGARG
ncbi:MAG: class I fructose-bisphosphate aldolase [Candidatus Dormibacteraceae bacterium]